MLFAVDFVQQDGDKKAETTLKATTTKCTNSCPVSVGSFFDDLPDFAKKLNGVIATSSKVDSRRPIQGHTTQYLQIV